MKSNNFSRKALSVTVSVAVVVAMLILNVGAAFLIGSNTFSDMTDSKLYTISEETKKFNSSLDEKVTISVINADRSNTQFELFMKRYAESGENISLEYLNTADDSKFLSEHGITAESSVTPYSILVSSEKRSQFIDFYSMYYYSNAALGISQMSYSQYNYYYSLFSSSESYAEYLYNLTYGSELYFCGEKAITSTVEYVTLDHIPHSYFLTGHGEDDAYEGKFASLLTYMSYAYGVLDITSAEAIPEDADCIMINTPSEDYSDAETEIILDYMKNGGRLLLITEKENLAMKNLMSIAEYYGATASQELIVEEVESTDEDDGETEPDEHTFAPVFNTDHDVFGSYGGDYNVKISNANPITVSEDLRPSQLVTPILTTSDKAHLDGSDNKGVYNVGIAVEEETDDGNSRMVWFSSADTFNDEEKASTDNLSLLVYAMTWMGKSYTSALGEISAPLFEDPMLNVPSGSAVFLAIVLIFIIPITLIVIGVVIYVKRKRA